MNGCAPGLALIERLKATRKWAVSKMTCYAHSGCSCLIIFARAKNSQSEMRYRYIIHMEFFVCNKLLLIFSFLKFLFQIWPPGKLPSYASTGTICTILLHINANENSTQKAV